MIKIKEHNLKIIIITLVFVIFSIYQITSGLKSFSREWLSTRGLLFLGIFFIAVLYTIISTIYGSYIEVSDGKIIQSEGFLKKNYELTDVKKIEHMTNIILGETLILTYLIPKINVVKQSKFIVLNLYKNHDVKKLLVYLSDRFPNIQLDEYCREIIRKN